MGLYSIPGYDRWKLDHPDHYATDPEDCPEWLAEELAGNKEFVAEAFGDHFDSIAEAFVRSGDAEDANLPLIAMHNAVAAYIKTVWEHHKGDTAAIRRVWRAAA